MLIGMLILAFATLIPNDQIQTASLLTFYLSCADHASCCVKSMEPEHS